MTENDLSAEDNQTTEAPQEVAPKPKYKKQPKKKFAPGELSGKTPETLKKIKLVGGQMLTGEPVPPPRPEEVRGQKIDWSNRHGFTKRHALTPELRAKYFGKLLVYAYAGKGASTTGKPSSLWKARCDCGKHITISAWDLKQGRKKHCGCGPTPPVPLKHLFQSTQAPQNPSVDPALVFARESLIAYACLQWAGYEPAAHHQLIAKYLEKVERGEIKRLMIFQPPRSGKLLADKTPVLTTEGWKTHGELKVGDFVYDLKGHPVSVLAVSEKQPAKMLVMFSGFESIKCHENHEWGVVYHHKIENKLVYDVLETKQIKNGLENGVKYWLPESPISNYEDTPVEIESIEERDPEMGHCIQISGKNGLYLVGKSLIPTHNSMLVSEYFPAWFLGKNPEKLLVTASYGQELASDFGRKVRNQIADPLFPKLFNGVTIAEDSSAIDKFNLNPPHKGGYFAVGVGGALTGRGAHVLCVDDPLRNREDADSESVRRKIKDWYTSVAYTRLMEGGAIIICQTRWHLMDLSGWLLEEHKHENWVVLNLPAINSKGEALWPERYPLETLYQIKKTLPSRDWEALYQQKPFIEEGGIFKREWWKMWPENKKFPTCSFVIQAWDTATTDKDLKSNSYSARTTWGIFQGPDDEVPNVILLEAWKERVEFPELQKEALRAYREYEPDKVLIEKKSSGQQLIQILRRMGLPLVEFLPEKIGDKTARAYAAQNLFENGRVYYPSRRWAEDVIDDLARFSPSSPNDITDSATSALIWLQKSWLLQHSDMKEEDDPTEDEEEDDLLPNNVRRFKPRKRSAYG
jgi:predicted phage terminase large subunit-like protein